MAISDRLQRAGREVRRPSAGPRLSGSIVHLYDVWVNESACTEPWTDLCALADVEVGRGHYVETGDRGLAVLRPSDLDVAVLDNRCPHAGGALAGGWISGAQVTCPWHGWAFDIHSGRCPDASAIAVRTYPARIVDDRVEALLGAKEQQP